MEPDDTFDPNVDEPEEELLFNNLALKNAVRRNMSIWRSHGATGERRKYSTTDDDNDDDDDDDDDGSESQVARAAACAGTGGDSSDDNWCCDASAPAAGNCYDYNNFFSELVFSLLCTAKKCSNSFFAISSQHVIVMNIYSSMDGCCYHTVYIDSNCCLSLYFKHCWLTTVS